MHVLDYMIRRGMQKTAKVFLEEAAVCDDPIGTFATLFFHLFIHFLHKNSVFFDAPCVMLLLICLGIIILYEYLIMLSRW